MARGVSAALLTLLLLPAARIATLEAQSSGPAGTSDVSVERIRRGLGTARPLRETVARLTPEQPFFRLRIEQFGPRAWQPLWIEPGDPLVPPYIRPTQPLAHYEFLKMVTPEDFRASTLHPIAIDLWPLFQKASAASRARQRGDAEQRERQRIREELERYKAQLSHPVIAFSALVIFR